MKNYKRNQIEQAIIQTLDARDARVDEIKLRLKRLLAADRQLGANARSGNEEQRYYAFYSEKPPGSGVEVMFSGYEAFALLAAITLLEHGFPQATAVKVMRKVRKQFGAAHAETLKKDRATLFDQNSIMAQAKPGMIATDSTDPIFLVIVRLTGSSADLRRGGPPVAICRGHYELSAFWKKNCPPGTGMTFFEFTRRIHTFADNLSKTRPVRRGRAAND